MRDLHALIRTLIDRFGPRRAGSQAEEQAQGYFRDLLRNCCDTTACQSFRAPLRAKFHALKPLCWAFYAALGLYWWVPGAAVGLAGLVAVLTLLHFVLPFLVLDKLYPKHPSLNVWGDIEPRGEPRQTLIFSGHMDSTPEFIWWYRLKQWGGRLTVLGIGTLLLTPLLLGSALLFGPPAAQSAVLAWHHLPWAIAALFAPVTIVLLTLHGKRVVPGAQDNLSGTATALGAAEALLAAGRLQHTRIRVLSFGAEEGGLRGSKAYVRAFRQQLLREQAVLINLDSLVDGQALHVVEQEPTGLVRYPPALVQRVLAAFQAAGVPARPGSPPIGGTDAASFARRGLPAVSILGLPLDRLHPTYHTRLDVPERLDPTALDGARQALIRLAQQWDTALAEERQPILHRPSLER
jgi:hypothetical protein